MTKWARMRRRKERRKAAEEESKSKSEVKLVQSENITDNIQHSQEIKKSQNIETPKSNYNNNLVSKKIFWMKCV